MVVRCIENRGIYPELVLPVDPTMSVSNTNFVATSAGITGDDLDEYILTIGHDYCVFGLLVYSGHVRYLIVADDGIPAFFPEALFSLHDHNISPDWSINTYGTHDGKLVVIGYDALSKSYDTLLALLREDPHALREFISYKQFYEEWNV